MALRIIGDHPLARDAQGNPRSGIGTIFPRRRTLVTLPGIHATQRLAFTRLMNEERKAERLPPLSEEEEMVEWQQSVDLIMDDDSILIRPDPENMNLAFEADELLATLVSKQKVKFLSVMNQRVRDSIKLRGENWRICPLPLTPEEMKHMIRTSRIRIGGRPIYYYNRMIGSRYLTYPQFDGLSALPPQELAEHLAEIRDYSGRINIRGFPEVAFFATRTPFGHADFAVHEFERLSAEALRATYETLKARFGDAVKPEFRDDNPDSVEWRNLMFSTLIGRADESISEEILLGLSPEFYMQIEWLPGGRIEEGEFVLDPIFDERDLSPASSELRNRCDDKARGFIFNFVREFGDIEYVNVGRVISNLSSRPRDAGSRNVYVAEVKQRHAPKPHVRIIRMQKWGIKEHLEEGKSLLQSIIEAEDYTEYILDRRLGCRQLGMNLPSWIVTRKISERYQGSRTEYEGQIVWSTYFEREYVAGIATDKIPHSRYQNPAYSLTFAELLGRAAATNIVVGRMNLSSAVLFDDGDEILLEDETGMPSAIIVADHTGAFADYQTDLDSQAEAYATPINRRLRYMPYPYDAAATYVQALVERLIHIQQEYRKRRRAFDTLFKHRQRDEHGSFAYRWERVLDRLNRTDPSIVANAIRQHLAIQSPANQAQTPGQKV